MGGPRRRLAVQRPRTDARPRTARALRPHRGHPGHGGRRLRACPGPGPQPPGRAPPPRGRPRSGPGGLR
ncbi:hypothetical protein ACFFX0_23550 [Citricoccus parietis]|uniref:Uncharacterized protein n=1 Tax=Citricoccus parietis TaxID=592307 RepID=A0ABV5G4Z4_9MICC